jgi:hypothetical protein
MSIEEYKELIKNDKLKIGQDVSNVKEEIFDQIEELNCSLRELTDYELVDCRQALINRTNILMGLMEELCDS